MTHKGNIDPQVVADFGDEWDKFDHQDFRRDTKLRELFQDYFSLVDWEKLPLKAVVADVGCGTGRWAYFVCPKVGSLWAVDPSHKAQAVARRNLADHANVTFACNSVDDLPMEDDSLDFAYSLGVLHHIPDTQAGIESIAQKLKAGAPFLLYLYYRFDNKPWWFQAIWRLSDWVRQGISKLPFKLKSAVTTAIALGVYWPLSRLALILERLGMKVDNIPLAFYRNCPFYVLKTDALDRFGTRLEKRFTQQEIINMLHQSGFERVTFREGMPYWVCLAYRLSPDRSFKRQ